MIDVDYADLWNELESGAFRDRLETELMRGFRQIQAAGERLPTASHYASQIAEIINRGAAEPLADEVKFELYQEVLAACEHARATILGEPPPVQ
ncbi:MAG TPA: hypothetical protein VGR95_02750 [Thermoanaerobaculia bacterium]|jgi:hypothetical protein|nr:hypothetical protein [Thermoanaerobaculia bacterium]